MINPQEYTVLLAEDDCELRRDFSIQLIKRGFSVITACNGEWLRDKAMSYKGNLDRLVILSDTDMPGINGDEACKKLLEDYPEFRRVIMIGMSDNSDNKLYWNGVGLWQTFIYKGKNIDNRNSEDNLACMLKNRINDIMRNPAFYLLADGSYRRSAV